MRLLSVPQSIKELRPHAVWYVIERIGIATLIGEGGGKMFHVAPIDLGLLVLGVALFIRPMVTRSTAIEPREQSVVIKQLIDDARYRFRKLSHPSQVALKEVFRLPGIDLSMLRSILGNRTFSDIDGAIQALADGGFIEIGKQGRVMPKGNTEVLESLEELANDLRA
jgi:hypothetical protein